MWKDLMVWFAGYEILRNLGIYFIVLFLVVLMVFAATERS